jgi:hypothetical protein
VYMLRQDELKQQDDRLERKQHPQGFCIFF